MAGKTQLDSCHQLLIPQMPLPIPLCLFLHILGKSIGEVNASLVGQANQHPKDIGHFVAEVAVLVRFLEGLLAVCAGDDAGQFADFFGEQGHVGQFVEITHAVGLNPFIDGGLGFFYRHFH